MKILRILLILAALVFAGTFRTGCSPAHAYNFFTETYSFTIMDSPHVLIINPVNKAVNINRDSKIIFEVTHSAPIKSIVIKVETAAEKTIEGSLIQTPIPNGFHCEFTPADLYPILTEIFWELDICI